MPRLKYGYQLFSRVGGAPLAAAYRRALINCGARGGNQPAVSG